VSPTRTRTREPDQACAQAVDQARAAAAEIAAAGQVGDHLGVQADGDRVVTHLFACTDPGFKRLLARPGTRRRYLYVLSRLADGPWSSKTSGPFLDALQRDVGVSTGGIKSCKPSGWRVQGSRWRLPGC